MALPTGAKDDGTAIHFANSPLVITQGFRTLYNSLAAKNLIPPDDAPLVNAYGASPVEQSNPAFWKGGGTAQETRYFRLGWSASAGARTTYIGQELRWYIDAYTSLQAQIVTLKAEVVALQAAAQASGTPQAVLDDINALVTLMTPMASAIAQLMHDAGIALPPPAALKEEGGKP